MSARLLLGLLACTLAAIAADVALDYFSGRSDGRSITLEWKPSLERNVQRYDIERSTDNRTWMLIASLDAKGSGTVYRYVDGDVLGKTTPTQPVVAGQVYYYRLRIVGADNSITYSSSITVTHNLSTVRRTWGMIKEMFR